MADPLTLGAAALGLVGGLFGSKGSAPEIKMPDAPQPTQAPQGKKPQATGGQNTSFLSGARAVGGDTGGANIGATGKTLLGQ